MHPSLWAPWRMAYIQELDAQSAAAKAAGAPAGKLPADSNFLARYWANAARDAEQLVVFRDSHGMVLLNRYPYANGHLLVALGAPQPTLADYSPQQRAHFWRLMELGMALCQAACEPQGMNVGINIGRAAGAGLPQHVHGHIVPRWNGDTNFMAVMGQVRVIPDALERSWDRYRTALPAALAQCGLA